MNLDLWGGQAHSLWTANLYPEKDSIQEAVAAALQLYDIIQNVGEECIWSNTNYKSLCSGFNDADSKAIIEWNKHMQSLVQMDEIVKPFAVKYRQKNFESYPVLQKFKKSGLRGKN